MIKLKKLSAIALAAVMAASALTGCGSKKDKSTVTTTPTDLSDEQPTTVDTSKETSSDTKDDSNSEKSFGLTQKTADGTILQCFLWSFNTIKDSLEDIALAGYSTIQTSPVNACYNGGDAGIDLNGSGNGTITISQQTGQSATTSLEQKKNSSQCVKKLTNTE